MYSHSSKVSPFLPPGILTKMTRYFFAEWNHWFHFVFHCPGIWRSCKAFRHDVLSLQRFAKVVNAHVNGFSTPSGGSTAPKDHPKNHAKMAVHTGYMVLCLTFNKISQGCLPRLPEKGFLIPAARILEWQLDHVQQCPKRQKTMF